MAVSMIDSDIGALRRNCAVRRLSDFGAWEELIFRICADLDSSSKYGQGRTGQGGIGNDRGRVSRVAGTSFQFQ